MLNRCDANVEKNPSRLPRDCGQIWETPKEYWRKCYNCSEDEGIRLAWYAHQRLLGGELKNLGVN